MMDNTNVENQATVKVSLVDGQVGVSPVEVHVERNWTIVWETDEKYALTINFPGTSPLTHQPEKGQRVSGTVGPISGRFKYEVIVHVTDNENYLLDPTVIVER
jgi:hypothetical protein